MKYYKILLTIIITLLIQTSYGQYTNSNQAIEDVKEFNQIIKRQSSYYQISSLNIDSLTNSVIKQFEKIDSVSLFHLTTCISTILSQINDSHSSLKSKIEEEFELQFDTIRFPIPTAPFDNKVVALNKTKNRGKYKIYNSNFPFIKEINGLETIEFLDYYAFENQKYPQEAKIYRSLKQIRKTGELYFKMSEPIPSKIELLLTNNTKDTLIILNPSKKNNTWRYLGDLGELPIRDSMKQAIPFQFENLIKNYDDQIDYIMIPKMISYQDYPTFEIFLEKYLNGVKGSNSIGLVIDIRGNSGGSRDIIKTLSKYLINVQQSPWVSNVTYLRNDHYLDEDISSMSSKYLYNYNSKSFNQKQRNSIDTFNLNFKLKYKFDKNRFSAPYYMVLNYSENHFLQKPTYILCDENSFSASSVLASALKGLKNVKICGTRTDGSSGRSMYFYLTNSKIRLKLSTMLSFQRNGLPLDGHGTLPDIYISRNLRQIMGEYDYQLEELFRIMKTRHNKG